MKAKILVVDDDEQIRDFVRAFLEPAGYELSEAADIASAHKVIDGPPADAVLLDLKLPDGHGLDLVPELRKKWPFAKVLILTGDHSQAAGEEAYKVDPQIFLVNKPFDLEMLQAMLELALSQKNDPRPSGG